MANPRVPSELHAIVAGHLLSVIESFQGDEDALAEAKLLHLLFSTRLQAMEVGVIRLPFTL